ncbi:MAG: PAS domain S-box protein [Thermodesulfobacteriota bacterium]|nr:PAS domain S-box protein [Thermodesulfobacteriota bacterium]
MTQEGLEERVWALAEEPTDEGRQLQQQFFLRVVEQSSEGIAVSDLDGYLLFVNHAFSAMHGYRPGELVGKRLSVFHSPEQMASVEMANRELKEKGVFKGEVWHLKKDGTAFPTFMNNALLRNEAGDPVGLIGTVRDITERQEADRALADSEERFRLAFENAVDAIIWADPETGLISQCNKAAETLLEKTRDEIIGHDQRTLHPKEKGRDYRKLFTRHLEGGEGGGDEAEVVSKSGKTIPVHITSSVTLVGGKRIIQGIFRDITELKQTEDDLRKARDALEQRVRERTAELSEANEKLQQEIRERKWAEDELFIYHQRLRSLTSELALAEERERRRIAVVVHDRIAQNLAFAKMSLGRLRASMLSAESADTAGEVIKLIDDTIQDTRALISELAPPILYELGFVPAVEFLTQQTEKRHNIIFTFADDGQPKPLSDDLQVLLFQAVRELLVNIVKHARARKAKVLLRADGDQVIVEVEDDGVGFDTAKIESSESNADCFGFFSIQQRLQPLGGRLSVESKVGRGTRIVLAAPMGGGQGEREGKSHEHKGASGRRP